MFDIFIQFLSFLTPDLGFQTLSLWAIGECLPNSNGVQYMC